MMSLAHHMACHDGQDVADSGSSSTLRLQTVELWGCGGSNHLLVIERPDVMQADYMPGHLGGVARTFKRNTVVDINSIALQARYQLQVMKEGLLFDCDVIKVTKVGARLRNLEAAAITYGNAADLHGDQVGHTPIHPSILKPAVDAELPIVTCYKGRGDSNAHVHVGLPDGEHHDGRPTAHNNNRQPAGRPASQPVRQFGSQAVVRQSGRQSGSHRTSQRQVQSAWYQRTVQACCIHQSVGYAEMLRTTWWPASHYTPCTRTCAPMRHHCA